MIFMENLITNAKKEDTIKVLIEENQRLHERVTELENQQKTYNKDVSNLLFKIQVVKSKLNKMNLKMTGYNNFKGYSYFELKDFVPATIDLMIEQGISSSFFVKDSIMYLEIVDSETGAVKLWETQLLEVQRTNFPKGDVGVLMKDNQAIQTYARRTLWLQVLELVEYNSIEHQEISNKQSKNEQNIDKESIKSSETIPPEVNEILDKISKDFGTKVPFNKRNIINKLRSMEKRGAIDLILFEKCMVVLNDIKE